MTFVMSLHPATVAFLAFALYPIVFAVLAVSVTLYFSTTIRLTMWLGLVVGLKMDIEVVTLFVLAFAVPVAMGVVVTAQQEGAAIDKDD
jgi:hypothetical protein